MSITAMNPATGEVLKQYPEPTFTEVKKIITAAHQAYLSWRETDFPARAKHLQQAARVLRANAADYAKMMALEMGKPVNDGKAEVEKCAWACDYYAEHGAKFLQPEIIATDAQKSFVAFQPIGVVLAVMPWNFPFWQVIRFAAPALMAGNAGVLKHASNVPGCALALEDLFREAGFPENLFRTLLIGSKQVDAVIENSHIAAVTLTGSTPAGQAVASKAGQMLKKTVLELGGSDPYILLEDADLDPAVTVCVNARLNNSGQSCIAAKRFIVVEPIRKQFEELFVAKMRDIKMGDPLSEQTRIGPQARHDLRDALHQQVQQSIAKGARCLLGGIIPDDRGAYYPPTILTDVKKGMPAYDEELFGPVAAVITVKNADQAIAVANDSQFGLGAAIFTKNVNQGEIIATKQLQAGSCFVNAQVRSDPRLPFGGIKESGYGRELSGFGIREFVNIKTVYIK